MPYGLYISAEGAQAQSLRMETIANNLANVDTTGFKRDLALFQARFAEETALGLDIHGSGSTNDLGGGVEAIDIKTDFSLGPLKRTDGPTDLALKGSGFFVVKRGDEDLLTRAGNFSIDPAGQLITADGYPVLAEGGRPVRIDATAGPISVSPSGVLTQGDNSFVLALVKPASLGDLARHGENLWAPLAPTEPLTPVERGNAVAQGYLEGSGVQATTEMMEMIETSRAFEANVNMIRNQDQMMGTLFSRILKT
jgi:flagellar basal-body rod protein FlgF/flagellar basal-body rod protein FlgG